MQNNPILRGLDLPPVVANHTLPLDQQLRAEQQAAVANNVHAALNGKVGKGTAAALAATTMKAIHLRDHFSAMFWAVIAPINNVAIMEVSAAFDLLKKEPSLFRQQVKYNAKTAMQRIDKYDKAVCRTMAENLNGDRKQYWLDYTDEHYAALQHDLDIFRLTILQELTKYNEPHREIKCRLVASHALLNYAVGMVDMYFTKVREGWHTDLVADFRDARLSYVLFPWLQVVDAICISKKPVDIDNNPDVRLAFKIIEQRLIDTERIRDIGDAALELNPDVENEVYHNPMNTDSNFQQNLRKCMR